MNAGSPDTTLVRRITREVADQLSERTTGDQERMSRDDERSYAHVLINASLEREAQARLRRGLPPASDDDDVAVAGAVHDRLFASVASSRSSTISGSTTSPSMAATACS